MPSHRIAVVVFAEVDDAINEVTAANVLVDLLQNHLPTETVELTRSGHTWRVTIHEMMSVSQTLTSGYLALVYQ